MNYNSFMERIGKAYDFDFPEFISFLRSINNRPRWEVTKETGISEIRLFILENGKYKRKPKCNEILMLSKFFNIDYDMLKRKSDDFIYQKKGKGQKGK